MRPALAASWADATTFNAAVDRAQASTRVLSLPFRGHLWRGHAGAWLGSGRGTSLEFQDHRAYVPGDDPRHINWQAYARTGVYSMKLYREEVSPGVDVALDVSASMVVSEPKAARVLDLLLFALGSARGTGGAVRAWALDGDQVRVLPIVGLEAGAPALTPSPSPHPPELAHVPWRSGSLRVWITDGLYDAPPDRLLGRLSAGGGRAVVLLPFAREEADPDWAGAVELEDCESGLRRDQRIDAAAQERYRNAYRRHFAAWADAGRRFGAAVARVPSETSLVDALRGEALTVGAVETLT